MCWPREFHEGERLRWCLLRDDWLWAKLLIFRATTEIMCIITASEHHEITKKNSHLLRGAEAPRIASSCDVVTLQWDLFEAENGFVAESLFDREGVVRFVLDGGNFLPGIHELVHNLRVGDRVQEVSIDAGYGASRKDLLFRLPRSKVEKLLTNKRIDDVKVGDALHLKESLNVTVTAIQLRQNDAEPTLVLDANHPLAGSSYLCSFTVLNIEHQSSFDVATFAMGCFWGGELAYQRQRGVVGTRCGYTQGITDNPTYEEVSKGATQHREAVQVLYDPKEVSYQELVELALSRLYDIPLLERMFQQDDEMASSQYRHGIYHHCESQRQIAEQAIDNDGSIELLPAAKFWPAEDYHQQYLYKRGQSARKGAKEPIRCFG